MTLPFSAAVLPDSAPFSPEQRAWLNGWFAGLMSMVSGLKAQPAPGETATPAPAARQLADPVVETETFPWHDPAQSMDERLALAQGRPRARVLMAAMAQLDCGACGYDCRTYAEAIDRGEETDLGKCAPGAAATSKKLRELIQATVTARATGEPAARSAVGSAAPVAAGTATAGSRQGAIAAVGSAAASTYPGVYSHKNPYPAVLIENRSLNAPGSDKDIRHIVFDLGHSDLTYTAGDALGVYAHNHPTLVSEVMQLLGAGGGEPVPGRDSPRQPISLLEALTYHYSLTRPTPALLELILEQAAPAQADRLRTLIESDDPSLGGVTLADLLRHFVSHRPDPARLVGTLANLQPRLYSISSSPRLFPRQIHLTVGVVRFVNGLGRSCLGVASGCMARLLRPGQRLGVFVRATGHFRLPGEPGRPVIMIGPGTGIAPFRGFLQDRVASKDPGRNWLFFGDRRAATDALYQDELDAYQKQGVLHHYHTAYSRDGAEKCYVQHRMLEHAAELWRWIEEGAHLYVCGDARRMAQDVHQTLCRIVQEQGGRDPADAAAFVNQMVADKRYQRDVY